MKRNPASNNLIRASLFSLVLVFAASIPAAAQNHHNQRTSSPPPSHPAPPPPHPSQPHFSGNTAHTNTNTMVRPNTNTGHTNMNKGYANTTSTAHPYTNTTHTYKSTGHTNTNMGTKTVNNGATTGPKAGLTTGAKTGTPTGTKTVTSTGAMVPNTVSHPGGNSVTNTAGHTTNFNSSGKKTSFETKNGTRANFDHGGHVSTIHTKSGMTINHGSHGERRYESLRRDGGRVVGYGHGHGYVEHGYYRGGRPYVRRSYYFGGHRYAYAYRGYYWHGGLYYGYVPPFYYAPGFYGWAYNPWAVPVVYGWGWGAAPWYGYYGYYFAPAPVYPSPSLWLADYLLAANLQAAYEARVAAGNANADAGGNDQAASGGPVTLTPEVKQAIADEVRAQLEAEKAAAANPGPALSASNVPPQGGEQSGPDEVPAALDPSLRTFLVSSVLSENTPDGTECSLSPGDVLTRIQDTPDENQSVKVLVTSSQRNDCASGMQIAVAVQDLQDMHNDFQAKMNEGLAELAKSQGKNGIPAGPAAAPRANPNGQAQPDLTVEADLQAQENEASQAEREVQEASVTNNGSAD
jgi:hypothetical protein